MPLHLMAWEKKGIGGGALSVLTASLRTMFAVWFVFVYEVEFEIKS
jgi:hypothetical protein